MPKRQQNKKKSPPLKPQSIPAPAQSAPASSSPAPAPLVSLGKANNGNGKKGGAVSAFHPNVETEEVKPNPESNGDPSTCTALIMKKDESTLPPTDFEYYREKHIRPLMDLNDRVNALTYQETNINATRIVVAGDQSHGKTSLLEALCGVDLPRGEGIQTRVPLVLQLRQSSSDDEEYAMIQVAVLNVLGKTTTYEERISLSDIGRKVREYTAKAAGPGKNIVDNPIELRIFRRNQHDLTLVDLPGITRVALEDQAGGDGKRLENQIMDMCRKYMVPKESILLNVVSAMVDFSTSASLQLSHELDPQRQRTLLCITKVDQHSEAGLHDKITKSIHNMNLKPQHVFAVRNRTQKENDVHLPLDEVRRLEQDKLRQLTAGQVTNYQLGVKALSKYLVKIQCEEILQTLPHTRNAIEEVAADLEAELEKLGEPVGSATECKAKAVQLIDVCCHRLEGEASGRVPTELKAGDSCEGEAFELLLPMDDFQVVYQGNGVRRSSPIDMGNYSFQLLLTFKKEDGEEEKAPYIGLKATSVSCLETTKVSVCCTFTVTQADHELARYEFEQDYKFTEAKSSVTWGRDAIVCSSVANKLRGEVTFGASVFVESVEINHAFADGSNISGNKLLCARLADLQDDFTSSIDTLYSNRYFFSEGFRKSLARELQGTRGGIGLPGNIASHVPVGVLRKLRLKLPTPVAEYRSQVSDICRTTTEVVILKYIGVERHPKLAIILIDCAEEILNTQASKLEHYHDKILEWEDNVCSSNHYFMDTVNSIRSSVYDSDSDSEDDKPLYLRHLTAESIAAMSNEDQKLVDQQIEIFAYWKLMKKRLVDYILLSTQGELVSTPFQKQLKQTMLETVFCRNDKELVELMSPDSHIVKTRASVVSRLEKLTEALKEIDDYKAKHPGGLVEIE